MRVDFIIIFPFLLRFPPGIHCSNKYKLTFYSSSPMWPPDLRKLQKKTRFLLLELHTRLYYSSDHFTMVSLFLLGSLYQVVVYTFPNHSFLTLGMPVSEYHIPLLLTIQLNISHIILQILRTFLIPLNSWFCP